MRTNLQAMYARSFEKTSSASVLRIEDEASLLAYAVGALARQMRTVAKLRRLLQTRLTKGRPTEAVLNEVKGQDADNQGDGLDLWRTQLIDRVVAKLQALGYLSDERFAATYSTLRKNNQALGRRRVERDLMNKGIARALVEREVNTVYAETSEETQARAFILRKRIQQPERGDRKAAAKIVRSLVRAGFSPGVVFKILRCWELPT